MALLARPGTGSVLVQREVEKAGDVREAWRQWAHRHPAEARAAELDRQLLTLELQGGSVVFREGLFRN